MTCNPSIRGDFSSPAKEAGRHLHLLPLSLPSAHEFPMGTEFMTMTFDFLVFVALLAFERRDAALLFSIALVFGLGLFGAASPV